MQTSKTVITSPADGLKISVLCIRPDGAPKAIVQLVHGMCEHKERYIPFMEFLASQGYVCYIHDHRGHGESVESIDDLGYFYPAGYLGMVEDIKAVGDLARQEWPGLKLNLLGHSMGSMAVRSFTRRYDDCIDSLVVCGSPSYNPGSVVGKWVAKADRLLFGAKHRPKLIQKLAFGSYSGKSKKMAQKNASLSDASASAATAVGAADSPNAWVCSDPDVVRKYDRDPLCNFQFTADGFINLFRVMEDAYAWRHYRHRNPTLPVLFISGADDPCLISHKHFEKAVETMHKAGYANVRAILYPGMRHEILNEHHKQEVWDDVIEFLAA